jgi:hypothetical protein
MRSAFSVLLLTLSVTAGAFGQTAMGQTIVASGKQGIVIGAGESAFGLFGRQVTGKPYSGEQTIESVQTLADGTHIKQTLMVQKVYRDSQGRTRTERQMRIFSAGNHPDMPTMIDISDPVAQVEYSFSTQNKTVRREEMAAAKGRIGQFSQTIPAPTVAVQSIPPSDPSRPQFKTEKLDPQTMEGLVVEGRRTTVTYPVGSMGNDREFVTTNELWTSPELGVMILSKNSDPRRGEQVQQLTQISRDEPDPTLFQPPAGYDIVDEKGSPNITLPAPR